RLGPGGAAPGLRGRRVRARRRPHRGARGCRGARRALRPAGRRGGPPRSPTPVDAPLIASAPKLRVIGRAGVGVDNVDVDAATAAGIVVCNAPEANVVSAAEHALALLLALARNISAAERSLRDGAWERERFAGVELADKTLALLGFGRIGRLVASRARALGMRTVAYDPYVTAERIAELGAERAESI